MRDFASQGLWSFPDAIFNFLFPELVENNWGKTGGGSRQLKMMTWFSLIWSQFQFLVIIYNFFGGGKNKESMLYAMTQPERELLVPDTVLEPRNTCTIRQRVFNCPIAPHVVHKSVEFSGVGSLTH